MGLMLKPDSYRGFGNFNPKDASIQAVVLNLTGGL